MKGRRVAIASAAVLLCAITVMAARHREAIWRVVFCEVVYWELRHSEQNVRIGWAHREWWKSEASPETHSLCLFHSSTGFQAYESNWSRDPDEKKVTVWDADGRLLRQFDGQQRRETPPWLWGKDDQAHPRAPWMRLGIDCDEWVARTFRR